MSQETILVAASFNTILSTDDGQLTYDCVIIKSAGAPYYLFWQMLPLGTKGPSFYIPNGVFLKNIVLRHDSHAHVLFPQWDTPQRSLNNFLSLSCYAFRWSVVQPLASKSELPKQLSNRPSSLQVAPRVHRHVLFATGSEWDGQSDGNFPMKRCGYLRGFCCKCRGNSYAEKRLMGIVRLHVYFGRVLGVFFVVAWSLNTKCAHPKRHNTSQDPAPRLGLFNMSLSSIWHERLTNLCTYIVGTRS